MDSTKYTKYLVTLGYPGRIDTFRAIMEMRYADLTAILIRLGRNSDALSADAQMIRRHLRDLQGIGFVEIFKSGKGNEYAPRAEGIKEFLTLMHEMCS